MEPTRVLDDDFISGSRIVLSIAGLDEFLVDLRSHAQPMSMLFCGGVAFVKEQGVEDRVK